MSRLARNGLSTSFFHVMCQGINKEKIFEFDVLKKKYITLMKKNLEKVDIEIISYCIMTNHVHMIIHTENISFMSTFMRYVNTEYAQFYNWFNNRVGYVFRDRFKSQPIYDEKYLYQCINYIHLNPVKAKIVNNCGEYEFSSYNNFLNNKFLKDSKFLKEFFSDKTFFNINNAEECSDFIDIDYDKSVVIDEYVSNYSKSKGLDINEILEDNNMRRELMAILLKSGLINKKDIHEKLKISLWKINN